jgi:cation transport regulator
MTHWATCRTVLRKTCPKAAHEIYKEAYNSAHREYKDAEKRRGKESLEEAAHKVDWAAVKKKYEKSNGNWHLKK